MTVVFYCGHFLDNDYCDFFIITDRNRVAFIDECIIILYNVPDSLTVSKRHVSII